MSELQSSETEANVTKNTRWFKSKGTITGMTLFSLGVLIGFFGGWLVGRQQSGQSLVPTPAPIVSPAPDIFIPYASPSPNTIAPGEPRSLPPDLPGVACTMEAKLCPDGSYVGRQAPNCEFAPCPGAGKSGSSSGSSAVMDTPVSTVAPQAR